MLLAGDLGGTKTNLAIFSTEAGRRAPVVEATFHSANYPSLEALAKEFLAKVNLPVDRATFGVAGPVLRGSAKITNLPWVMDETHLGAALGLSSVRLLNDLEAIANAVPFLEPVDLYTLNTGESAPGGALGVIAPGTGLGEAFLVWDGAHYRTQPSEGGHVDFAPTNPLESGMLRYLQERFGHVSYERVCSGMGLPNIYAYLKESGYAEEPPWLAAQLAATSDHTPVIVNAALGMASADSAAAHGSGALTSALCVATLDMFAAILAAEAGNLALKVLATGGIYIGGGIPPRILSVLTHERFMRVFRDKGRFSEILDRIPVHVILNPKVALLGAAAYGLETSD